ncbi:NAD-dependent epimerase/dehydratase family protein [Egicoccus sp. AB-alg2]|uniref:NAD-dependent epimerase/dehydratase family protein n=1 Tax=Egicoccus sp. AB-alg2 TaxID=3242693 RepID=UPI00359EF04F
MSRVLITGAAGRLGRSTVAWFLARGHDVVAVDRVALDATSEAAGHAGAAPRTVVADLTDADRAAQVVAEARPDAIVHLAAIAVPFSAPEPTIFAVNTAMAFNVCQAGADVGVDAVVVASSPTPIGYGNPRGWTPRYLPLDEDHPLEPWHAYGLSKVVLEETVRAFARAAGDRTRFHAVRPCYVIAPEEWAGAPTQQGHTVRERLLDPALSAVALFNYVDARDAAALFECLVTAGDEVPNGEVFFAAAPDALATAPLAELLPAFHPGTTTAATALTGDAPAFTAAKAQRLLGWTARHTWRHELHDTTDLLTTARAAAPTAPAQEG